MKFDANAPIEYEDAGDGWVLNNRGVKYYDPSQFQNKAAGGIVSNAQAVSQPEVSTPVAPIPPPESTNKTNSAGWYTELGKVGDQPGMDYWNQQITAQGYDKAYAGFMASAKDNIKNGKAVGIGDIPKVTANPITTTPTNTPVQTTQYNVNGQDINSPTYNAGYNPAYDYGGAQYSSTGSTTTPNQALAAYDAANAALKKSDPARYNLERSRVYEQAQMAAMTPQQRADFDFSQKNNPTEPYINQNGTFVPNPNYNPFYELRNNSDPGLRAKYNAAETYNPDGTLRVSGAAAQPAAPANPYSPVTSGGGIVSNANANTGTNVTPGTGASVGTGANGASNYNPAQLGNPNQWNVTAPQTVAGQIQSLIDPNSALGKQAVAQGQMMANDRGLLNSSISQTAAQSELNKLALGIAGADAATNAKAAGYNADMGNQFAVQNFGAQNTAGQFNAGQNNNWQLGQLQANTSLATTQMNNASAQATAQLQAKTQELVAKLQAGTQLSLADKEIYGKLQLADADAKTRINLANIDAKTRADLGAVEAKYKNELQTNQSAANLYQQHTQNIAQIQMSKDMDAAAKDAAIKNQQTILSDGLKILSGISGLSLGDLIIAPGTNTLIATPTTTGGAAGGGTGTPTADAYTTALAEGH